MKSTPKTEFGLRPLVRIGFALVLSVASLISGACTHQQLVGHPMLVIFQDMLLPTPQDAPVRFRNGVRLLNEKKYEAALAEFDQFLSDSGSTRWAQAAVIDSGRALEGMSRWTEALSKYRAAIDATERRAPKLQTYALYRASFCYETLGDDQATVAVLLDLLSPARAGDLPHEALIAEIPGRLAAAYARLGQIAQAMDFYQQAEAGVAQLKASAHGKYPSWLGQTLYLMGKVPTESVSWENAGTVLRALDQNQKFAVEAAALAQDPWSRQASQALIGSYRDLFTVLQAPPISKWDDPILAQRDAQRSQWNLASEILQRLNELKAYQLPDSQQDSAEANDIFEFADDLMQKLQVVLQERPAGDGLTEASALRIAARAAGAQAMPRVLAPDPVLENAASHLHDTDPEIKRAKSTEMLNLNSEKTRRVSPSTSVPLPAATPAASKDDPNL